jgi:hypothetical protein
MREIHSEAAALVARAVADGLIKVCPPKPPTITGRPPKLPPDERRAKIRILKRDWMRQNRHRRRPNKIGVSRYDFPDGPEGTLAFNRAYHKAWAAIPENRAKLLASIRKANKLRRAA